MAVTETKVDPATADALAAKNPTASDAPERKVEKMAATPADIAPATEFDPSGAPRQTVGVDVNHPAIDNNPRAGTSVLQNRIDMNDPVTEASEQVENHLADQGAIPKSVVDKREADKKAPAAPATPASK